VDLNKNVNSRILNLGWLILP